MYLIFFCYIIGCFLSNNCENTLFLFRNLINKHFLVKNFFSGFRIAFILL